MPQTLKPKRPAPDIDAVAREVLHRLKAGATLAEARERVAKRLTGSAQTQYRALHNAVLKLTNGKPIREVMGKKKKEGA